MDVFTRALQNDLYLTLNKFFLFNFLNIYEYKYSPNYPEFFLRPDWDFLVGWRWIFSALDHDVMEDVFIKVYDVNKPNTHDRSNSIYYCRNESYFFENLGHYKWPYYTFFSSLFLRNFNSFSLSLIFHKNVIPLIE